MPEDCPNQMRLQYLSLVEAMLSLNSQVDEKLKVLEARERQHNAILARVNSNKDAAKSKISLNVGGHVFTTSKETLLRFDETYFCALLGSDAWTEEDGTYFIDRSPVCFDRILAALRYGEPIDYSGLSSKQAEQLRVERDYYQLPSWVDATLMTWDTSRCSRFLKVSECGRILTKTSTDCTCSGAIVMKPDVPSFKIRIRKMPKGDLWIGYVSTAALDVNPDHAGNVGWCLYANGCRAAEPFSKYSPPLNEGDLVVVQLDVLASTISFRINGVQHGIAFQNVKGPGRFLIPFIRMLHVDSSVSLEE